MAKKKRGKEAFAPPEPPKKEQHVVFNVLLDWRFNLVILVLMETLLIVIFRERETIRYYEKTAKRALLSAETAADFEEAHRKYWWLHKNEPTNPDYLQALGDTALGRERYSEAETYYRRATNGRYDRPGVKLSVALSYRGRASKTRDPATQIKYLRASYQLMELAYREAPRDLKANYWKAMFAKSAGDYVEAAEFFSRVSEDMIPQGRPPNVYEKRLIADAKNQIASIKALVLKDRDYALDVNNVVFKPRPVAVTPPPAPKAKPTSPPVSMAPEAATTPTK